MRTRIGNGQEDDQPRSRARDHGSDGASRDELRRADVRARRRAAPNAQSERASATLTRVADADDVDDDERDAERQDRQKSSP